MRDLIWIYVEKEREIYIREKRGKSRDMNRDFYGTLKIRYPPAARV